MAMVTPIWRFIMCKLAMSSQCWDCHCSTIMEKLYRMWTMFSDTFLSQRNKYVCSYGTERMWPLQLVMGKGETQQQQCPWPHWSCCHNPVLLNTHWQWRVPGSVKRDKATEAVVLTFCIDGLGSATWLSSRRLDTSAKGLRSSYTHIREIERAMPSEPGQSSPNQFWVLQKRLCFHDCLQILAFSILEFATYPAYLAIAGLHNHGSQFSRNTYQ